MDADILRLVLFISGVALILGIYFWDRHKKINVRINAIHKAEREKRAQVTDQEVSEKRQEPVWDGVTSNDSAQVEKYDFNDRLRELSELVEQERGMGGSRLDTPSTDGAIIRKRKHSDTSQLEHAVPVPQKIVQINLLARNKQLHGDDLMRAARDLQLDPGEMQIFHRYHDRTGHKQSLFSMASMVEPGTFPFRSMGNFNTPGVTLFAQLPGPLDGIETFNQMLAVAQRLGALLDAELLDETRSVLSRQTIDHIREEISEHGRLVRLARSR
ncbi:MAG: cell division protein ZipA [Gammaproteobacteria bacterium]|nr:cell division protein ZipA [Gammaproteobacteria bacterium]